MLLGKALGHCDFEDLEVPRMKVTKKVKVKEVQHGNRIDLEVFRSNHVVIGDRCGTIDESETQETSPEIQNKGTSGPKNRTCECVCQNNMYDQTKFIYYFCKSKDSPLNF